MVLSKKEFERGECDDERRVTHFRVPAHFDLRPRPPDLHADLLSSDSCRKWAGSASNQLTSGSLLGCPYFGSLWPTTGPLRPTSVPYPVVVRAIAVCASRASDPARVACPVAGLCGVSVGLGTAVQTSGVCDAHPSRH